jgi:hypothetical protein
VSLHTEIQTLIHTYTYIHVYMYVNRSAIKCYEAGSVNLPYDSVPVELCCPPTDAVLQFEHKYGSQPIAQQPLAQPLALSGSRPGTSATTASTGSCGSNDSYADTGTSSSSSKSYKRRALQLRQWSLLVTDETLKSVAAQQAARHQAVANSKANAQVRILNFVVIEMC